MRIVIIGGVAGGMSTAARLRRLSEETEIIVLERSGFVSFANCGLPYFIGGVIVEQDDLLLQTPESLRARFNLDVRVNSEVTAIKVDDKQVAVRDLITSADYQLDYDVLVLSPGAAPIKPPIPGIERAITLRNIEDSQRINRELANAKTAAIIGAGFIGVELAENLTKQGIKTALIEASDQVLAPLDPELAALVKTELTTAGVQVHLAAQVTEISTSQVHTAGGHKIAADLVISAIGVRPETQLAHAAGIKIGDLGGIKVDDRFQTSAPGVYAIGDAIEKVDVIDGSSTLVPLANTANRQGRYLADLIMGIPRRPIAVSGTAIVGVFGLQVASTGWNEKRLRRAQVPYVAIHTHPYHHAAYYPDAQQISLKLLFHPVTGEIYGAQGVGKAGVDKRIDVIATAIAAKIPAPELADLELTYAPQFGSAKDPINQLGYLADNVVNAKVQLADIHDLAAVSAEGATILDVRTEAEFANGTIPGAINIPLNELRKNYQKLRNEPIIVFCQVGVRGHVAARMLTELGYQVQNFSGGYLTWKANQK